MSMKIAGIAPADVFEQVGLLDSIVSTPDRTLAAMHAASAAKSRTPDSRAFYATLSHNIDDLGFSNNGFGI